jgi:Zn ribbon nucleic-acid-binding protein
MGGTTTNCPDCDSTVIQRMYLHHERIDICRCARCGSEWDEVAEPESVVSRLAG